MKHAEAQIDAALARLGRERPSAGLEQRIAARLSAESLTRPNLVLRIPLRYRFAVAAMAAGLGVAAVLLVSNEQRRHASAVVPAVLPAVQVVPLPRIGPAGFGSSGAVRVPEQPIQAAVPGRSRVHRGHGRAVLNNRARRTQGAAVPASPYPAIDAVQPVPGTQQP